MTTTFRTGAATGALWQAPPPPVSPPPPRIPIPYTSHTQAQFAEYGKSVVYGRNRPVWDAIPHTGRGLGNSPTIGGMVSRAVGTGLLIVSAANLIVDAIGQAGAYKWRDNLLNQLNGGNSNKKESEPPPFRGGQTPYAIYLVDATGFVDATFRPNQHFGAFRPSISGFGPISSITVEYAAPSDLDSRHQWALVIQFANYTYRGGVLGISGAENINQFTWGVEDILVRRLDGQPDTGGDLQGATSGEDNPNPFLVPPVESYPSPDIYPNSILLNVGANSADALQIPSLATIPSPNASIPSLSPFPSDVPLTPPFPRIPQVPIQGATGRFSPSQSVPAPSSTIAPPTIDISKLIAEQRASMANADRLQREAQSIRAAQSIQSAAAKQPVKETVCEEAQEGKCIDRAIKRNQPESVPITVKEFDKCGDDGKPVFKTKSINVPKGSEVYIRNLFEEIADTAGLSCSINVTATLPDSWAGKVPDDRPQAAVYYREWTGNKWGNYTCSVHIPYYSKPKGFKPSLPTIKKGGFFGILKLKDNSQIYVNCESIQEAKRVITELRKYTGVEGKGARAKYGEYGDGDLKKVTVKPVRLDFYPKGRNSGIGWSVDL